MEPRVMFVSQKRFWEVSNINSLGSSPVIVLDWSEAGRAALRKELARLSFKISWPNTPWNEGGDFVRKENLKFAARIITALTPRQPRKKGGAK
jgi:hypothetical protein